MPGLGSGLRIPDQCRARFLHHDGAALDRNAFIVARLRPRGGFCLRDRLMLHVERRELFELEYPVAVSHYARDYHLFWQLSNSLSCSRAAPLGRAIIRLQRRVRIQLHSRRFLRRLLEQLMGTSDELNRRIIGYI